MENSKKGLEGIIQKKTPWIIVGIVEIVVLVASILFAVGVFSSGQGGGIPANNSAKNTTLLELPQDEVRALSVGDTFYFGQYEQDNDIEKGPELIEWVILTKEGNQVTAVSKKLLDSMPYDEAQSPMWDECSLRKWLNDSFWNTAFSAEEKALVQTHVSKAQKKDFVDSSFQTIDYDLEDQVFILSKKEASDWFSSDQDRIADPTLYAVMQMKPTVYVKHQQKDKDGHVVKETDGTDEEYLEYGTKISNWWLRRASFDSDSSGFGGYHVDGVDHDGAIVSVGPALLDYICVRPAVVIDFSTLLGESPGMSANADSNQSPVGETQQKITVRPSANGHELVLETMNANGEWESVFTCPAKISTSGTTTSKTEGDGKTPEGTFNVLFALSDQALDTNLQTYTVANGDVWVDDSSSKYYNTLQKSGASGKDWSSAEDIYRYFTSGNTSAVIYFDYNGDGVSAGSATPGAGSAIFLYGRNDYSGATSTSGDLYIAAGDMTKLLSYLDSSKKPTLTIENTAASSQSDFIGGGPHAPDVLVSTVDELMLRTGPGTNYQAIAKLSKGDTFNSFESKDGWAHGYYGDLEGWVSEQYLTKSLAAVGDYSDYENAVAQFDPMHIAGTGIGPYNIVLRGEDNNYAYYQAYAGGGWECVKVSKTYPYPVEYMSASERAIYEDSPYN